MEGALSDSAGISAVQQLRTTYVNDVDHHRRRAFEQTQVLKSAQRPTGDHGIMVPDVAFENYSRGGRGSARREAPVIRNRRGEVRVCGALTFTQGWARGPHAATS